MCVQQTLSKDGIDRQIDDDEDHEDDDDYLWRYLILIGNRNSED